MTLNRTRSKSEILQQISKVWWQIQYYTSVYYVLQSQWAFAALSSLLLGRGRNIRRGLFL